MNTDLLIPFLTFGGTLLLVVTGLLNFSVFVRQLRAAREQLDTARRQLIRWLRRLLMLEMSPSSPFKNNVAEIYSVHSPSRFACVSAGQP
ncbi:MAG TPA: hypothetical protein VF074_15590, partial [Pyrinomonadaceae bacterium]